MKKLFLVTIALVCVSLFTLFTFNVTAKSSLRVEEKQVKRSLTKAVDMAYLYCMQQVRRVSKKIAPGLSPKVKRSKLRALIDMKTLSRNLGRIQVAGMGALFILNDRGAVLYPAMLGGHGLKNWSGKSMLRKMRREKRGTLVSHAGYAADGKSIVAFYYIQALDWVVIGTYYMRFTAQ